MTVNCSDHPERDGRFSCSYCRRNFCVECVSWTEGQLICRRCREKSTEGGAGAPPNGGDGILAWEQRDWLLDIDAIFSTVKDVLLRPTATFSSMRTDRGLADPLSFALLLGTIGALFSLLWQPLQFSLIPGRGFLPAGSGQPPAAVLITLALISPLLITVGMFLSAGLTHLALVILGAASRPFAATFRVYCYINGSLALLQVVPVCGSLAALLWSAILYLIALAAVHRISSGRAALAMALPFITCCSCAVAILAAVFAGLPTTIPSLALSFHCPFHALTGIPCPTCGGLRAVAAIVRLDFSRAFVFNPLVSLGALAGLPATVAALTIRQQRREDVWKAIREQLNKPPLQLLATLILATNWLYLLLVGR